MLRRLRLRSPAQPPAPPDPTLRRASASSASSSSATLRRSRRTRPVLDPRDDGSGRPAQRRERARRRRRRRVGARRPRRAVSTRPPRRRPRWPSTRRLRPRSPPRGLAPRAPPHGAAGNRGTPRPSGRTGPRRSARRGGGRASRRARRGRACRASARARAGSARRARRGRARPIRIPACGPPSTLSPEKQTRSAPASSASSGHGLVSEARLGEAARGAGARVVHERDAAGVREGRELGERDLLREADDPVVRGPHLEDRGGARVERLGVVVRRRPVRRPDLEEGRAALARGSRDAEVAADRDELAARDGDFLPVRERVEGEEERGGRVRDREGVDVARGPARRARARSGRTCSPRRPRAPVARSNSSVEKPAARAAASTAAGASGARPRFVWRRTPVAFTTRAGPARGAPRGARTRRAGSLAPPKGRPARRPAARATARPPRAGRPWRARDRTAPRGHGPRGSRGAGPSRAAAGRSPWLTECRLLRAMPVSIERELDLLERSLTTLKVDYERFFSGDLKVAPRAGPPEGRGALAGASGTSTSERAAEQFRLQALEGRFTALTERWDKRSSPRRKRDGASPARRGVGRAAPAAGPVPAHRPRSVSSDGEASTSVKAIGRGDLKSLFDRFCAARAAVGEDVSRLRYDRFEDLVKKQAAEIRRATGATRLAFEVQTREGKVRLVGRPLPAPRERQPMKIAPLSAPPPALVLALAASGRRQGRLQGLPRPGHPAAQGDARHPRAPRADPERRVAAQRPRVPHRARRLLARRPARVRDRREARQEGRTRLYNAGLVQTTRGEWGAARSAFQESRRPQPGQLARLVDARIRGGEARQHERRGQGLRALPAGRHVALRREAQSRTRCSRV